MKNPIVIAHRGATENAPENTLLAFESACRLGAQMFELDVHETSDNHLVCIHDYSVDRTTNGEGMVSEMTLAEIRELDAGMGECVPLLSEVLELAAGRARVNIELKVMDIETRVVDLLTEKNMLSEVIVSSFLHESLTAVKAACKDVSTAVLYSHSLEGPVAYALGFTANAINPRHELVTEDLLREAWNVGLHVYPWTVNSQERVLELAQLGVDGIITDHTEMAIDVLRKR